VSSLLLSAVALDGCAKADGTVSFGPDATPDTGATGGADATTHMDATTFPDTGPVTIPDTGSIDQFVAPTPDAGGETGSDSGPAADTGAPFDAGLLFYGNPGTSCATLGAVQAQQCGVCGTQTSTCIVMPDGGVPFDAGASDAAVTDAAADAVSDAVAADAADAGDAAALVDAAADAGTVADAADAGPTLVWGEFGACSGEVDGGCLPGTTTTVACGLCGTQSNICQNDCTIGTTNCVGQVLNGCTPGSVQFTLESTCTTANAIGGYAQTCSSTCALQSSMTCTPPPTTLTVPVVVGGKVNTYVDFVAAQEDPRLALQSCPTTLVTTAPTSTPYAIVTLNNPSTTQTATVSVWTSQVTGQPVIDTAITAYASVPMGMAMGALKACSGTVTDSCADTSDPTSCLGGVYGGLMVGDFNAVTIPIGGSIAIFLQDQFADTADLGVVQVTARTESFQ
jgi:hypothetical protein